MSSPRDLFDKNLNELLMGYLPEDCEVDSSEWTGTWDLRALGRGPHALPIIEDTGPKEGKVKLGEVEFTFKVNPDADMDRADFYIVEEKSVVIHLWPFKPQPVE